MTALEQSKVLAERMMQAVVCRGSGRVIQNSLTELDMTLRHLGFRLIRRMVYGPEGEDGGESTGRQLFYRLGQVLVRFKTEGDGGGFREGQAHLSAGLFDGNGMDWYNDLAKFDARGRIAPKAIQTQERYDKIDRQGNPNRFIVILGGLHEAPVGRTIQNWADAVHFPCDPTFDPSGADDLPMDE